MYVETRQGHLPEAELEACVSKLLQGERASVVLRELGKKYGVNRSALGFFIVDLASEKALEACQAIWAWDIDKTGRGLSDEQLEAELRSLGVRFRRP